MAKAKARSLAAGRAPYRALARPLSSAQRQKLSAYLVRLVRWQQTLRDWPVLDDAPDATAFVSVYARGRLVGCFGSDDATPRDRVARAFVRAIADTRRDAITPEERAHVTAQLSYPIAIQPIDARDASSRIEAGTHGVASRSAILLPDVARDNGWNASQLLDALARKQGDAIDELWHFRTERVTSQPSASGDAQTMALDWLERLVDREGRITFAIDPTRRARTEVGTMHHGRAAVVVQALAQPRQRRSALARARTRLEADLRAALRGRAVVGWPEDDAMVVGTLALACRAGLPLHRELRAQVAERPLVARSSWHAAQAVAALGREAPTSLWRACVRALEREPWAPWTAIAAHARGDGDTFARTTRSLAAQLRDRPPHAGGADRAAVPEIALTALVVEALQLANDSESRAAVARGQDFLRRWQLVGEQQLAAHDPALALGAFPGSPVSDTLRGDITAHAVLACWPEER